MSDDKNYEIHLHFKREPLQVPEAELKDYLDRVPECDGYRNYGDQ